MSTAAESGRVPLIKPRLLVVPHIYADDIAVREIELARRLGRSFEVFVLGWQDVHRVQAPSLLLRRVRQLKVAIGAAFNSPREPVSEDGFVLVESPVLQPVLFKRILGAELAQSLCQLRNRKFLRSLLHDLRITHLLLANDNFGVERIPGVRTFFDFVDWFPEERMRASRLKKIRANLRSIAANAEGVFGVSEPLCEKLERECAIEPIPVPNGADLSGLRSVPPTRVQELRRSLGLQSRFVIGYVGNHGRFTGVDLVVNAFLAVRSRLPDAALLIVGPADPWREILEAHRLDGVIATGGVPPDEIGVYFNAIDLGILAQEKTTGTDYAFQIKVVEYSACRKCVVSTPLCTWQRLRWPNVLLAEPDPLVWADAFVRARSIRWQADWDRIVEPYDWAVLADKVAAIMLGVPAV